jgi:hypothetical protein
VIPVLATLLVSCAIFAGGAIFGLLLIAAATAGEPDPPPPRPHLYDIEQDGGI